MAVTPTGSLSLDHALGVGGLPKGRVVEVRGQCALPRSPVEFATSPSFDEIIHTPDRSRSTVDNLDDTNPPLRDVQDLKFKEPIQE